MMCPEPWFSSVGTSGLEAFETDRPGEFDDKLPFYQEAIAGDWSRFDDPYPLCVSAPPGAKRRHRAASDSRYGSFIDARVGRMLDLLENAGQLENTVIVYTSDHG